MKISIRQKILRLVLITSITIGLIISAITSAIIYQIVVSNNDSDTALMAQAYSTSVETSMKVIQTQIQNAAKEKGVGDETLSAADRKAILTKAAEGTVFSSISVTDKNGMTYDAVDVSQRSYFKQAIAGNTYIASPAISKKDGKLAIMVGAPVTSDGSSGIVIGQVGYSYFSEIISNIKVGKNGYGYIVDNTGTIIAHPDIATVEGFTNYVEKAKEDSTYSEIASVIEKMKSAGTGHTAYNLDGVKEYISYIPIEGFEGWSLGVCVPYSEVMSSFWLAAISCAATLIVLTIISILITLKISKSIAKPITIVTQRLEALAMGDINSPVDVAKTNDETLILSTALSDTVYSLKTYIGDIDNVLSNISDGNLTVQTGDNYVGDFMPIKSSLTNIISSLRETFININQASVFVKTSAAQVSSGATILAESASTEASTIEELNAMVSDISGNVKHNAENAKNASNLTRATSEQVDSGNSSMNQMLSAMSDISQSSDQISKIIKVIDDIAFQTNILALNAAVEAARAGNAGKGFAVVADEVRNLAAKSAVAAKDTSALIEASITAVQKGTDLAGETASALNKIVSMVGEVEEIMDKIAISSNEQATAITQINVGMEQITNVIQTNSATAEESAASSEELTGQANLMKEKIDKFNL